MIVPMLHVAGNWGDKSIEILWLAWLCTIMWDGVDWCWVVWSDWWNDCSEELDSSVNDNIILSNTKGPRPGSNLLLAERVVQKSWIAVWMRISFYLIQKAPGQEVTSYLQSVWKQFIWLIMAPYPLGWSLKNAVHSSSFIKESTCNITLCFFQNIYARAM